MLKGTRGVPYRGAGGCGGKRTRKGERWDERRKRSQKSEDTLGKGMWVCVQEPSGRWRDGPTGVIRCFWK